MNETDVNYKQDSITVFVLRTDPGTQTWTIQRAGNHTCSKVNEMDDPIGYFRVTYTSPEKDEKFIYVVPPSEEELENKGCSKDCIKAHNYLRKAFTSSECRSISMQEAMLRDGQPVDKVKKRKGFIESLKEFLGRIFGR